MPLSLEPIKGWLGRWGKDHNSYETLDDYEFIFMVEDKNDDEVELKGWVGPPPNDVHAMLKEIARQTGKKVTFKRAKKINNGKHTKKTR